MIKRLLSIIGLLNILLDIKYWYASYTLAKNDYVFAPRQLKTKFYLPLVKTDFIQRGIFATKTYYEVFSLSFVTKEWNGGAISTFIKERVVFDIGANIGNHTLYFLNECDAKYVYCFEPASDTFDMLKKNIGINHLDNRVKLINAGVGASSGFGGVKSVKGNTGFTKIEPSENGSIKILAIDEMDIPEPIGLVKIDVEGFEVEVLRGMMETIKKFHPYIMIEIDGENYETVCSILEGIGYQHLPVHQHSGSTDNHLFYHPELIS